MPKRGKKGPGASENQAEASKQTKTTVKHLAARVFKGICNEVQSQKLSNNFFIIRYSFGDIIPEKVKNKIWAND